jgi:hypothetical protein
MLNSKTDKVLSNLQDLYATGFQDTFLDNALNKIVERQIERDESDLARIRTDQTQFERDYEMASADFWRLYQTGQMADTIDNFEWNVLCKAQERIEKRLAIQRGSVKKGF